MLEYGCHSEDRGGTPFRIWRVRLKVKGPGRQNWDMDLESLREKSKFDFKGKVAIGTLLYYST
jgi:hypothetical protein